ncbi:MAG TPA: PhnD/SsuA/transferrin family substrate-binding protein [Rhodocyclaceae bacterium]
MPLDPLLRRLRHLACLCLAALPAVGAAADADKPAVRIGILAYRGPMESVESWASLSQYLGQAIPGHRFEQVLLDGPSLRDAVRNRRLDFVLVNPGLYVSLAAESGVQRIATVSPPESLSPERSIGSAVVARKDRQDLAALADLRGKRIAAVAADAFGGYLAGAREFHHAGIELESGDAAMSFLGPPQRQALEAVRDGRVDAAIVRTCLIEQLAAKGVIDPREFKVLSRREEPDYSCATSTPLYPDWPIAVTRAGDRELAKAVTIALLSMPPAANGLTWGVPADYQSVHDLFQEQMTGPYAGLAATTVRGLLKRYRPYVLLVLVIVLGFLAHVVRVESLVSRRTAELRRAEERARRLQQEAEHMARLSILGEMAGTLAHEINQPLASISTFAQSIQRRYAAGRFDAEQIAAAAGEIADQAERAGGVVRRIRNFARKYVGAREVKPLADTVREAVTLFGGMMPALPPVAVDDRLPPGSPVDADHLQLQQVLLNLLKNAADAMSELPVEQRCITVRLERAEGRLRICVADRGPAVPAETLARLFEPFFTTKSDGLGLGLAICKSIAEAHGGRLVVEPNVPPPGLAFCLVLPPPADHE